MQIRRNFIDFANHVATSRAARECYAQWCLDPCKFIKPIDIDKPHNAKFISFQSSSHISRFRTRERFSFRIVSVFIIECEFARTELFAQTERRNEFNRDYLREYILYILRWEKKKCKFLFFPSRELSNIPCNRAIY